jgi:hypothetical protein
MTTENVTALQTTSEMTRHQFTEVGTSNIVKRPADDENYSENHQNPQRRKREWLTAPVGIRHPRIGSEFQVSSLPSPSE